MNERKPKEEKKINENFQNELDTLTSISSIVFGLNKENTRESAKLIYQNHYDDSISFNTIIVQMIYNVFVIKMKDDDEIYSDFIKEMTILELHKKSKSKIFNVFSHYLLHKCTGESFYILNKMVENKFFDVKIVQKQNSSYFAHYISEKEAKNFRYTKEIEENYEELSKNDWELHKKLIKEGHNPNEIAKIIRNDEIEKLQEISTQINFDFNQKIKPSLYERCSFVNDYNVTLIDYAAFFSSVKCFKYLIMNGANAFNTGKYAIAGGNEEIIHLCEQNHSTFKDAYETAIEFHHNNIFKYLYENKIAKINDLEELGKKCVLHHNYELFSFLTKEGMKINNDIINESAKIGNIFLTKYFLEFNTIPKDILIFSSESGNIELVKYILEQGIDVNTKNEDKQNALMIAVSLGYIKIVKLLLEQEGIDINAKDDEGDTALLYANDKDTDIVKLLLAHEGFNINSRDILGWTNLMKVIDTKRFSIATLLLGQKGIDVNATDLWGNTALMIASTKGDKEIVKFLLEQKGIDINARDEEGFTALMVASANGYKEIVKLLLEQKGIDIDINIKNNFGIHQKHMKQHKLSHVKMIIMKYLIYLKTNDYFRISYSAI